MVAGPLAGKLQGAESNTASSWLPGKAESTQALNIQDRFQSQDVLPAVIVYERASGLTSADHAKLQADVCQYARIPDVTGRVIGPIVSRDNQASQIMVSANLGPDGWNHAQDFANKLKQVAGGSA